MNIPAIVASLALALLGLGFLQYHRLGVRKTGLACLWLASGLVVFFLTGVWYWGLVALSLWMVVPMLEMILVVRHLRVPREFKIEKGLPPEESLQGLREISREFVEAGFVQLEDCFLTPAHCDQYFRLLKHETEPLLGMVGYVGQDGVGFHFLSILSQEKSGQMWLSWNYPLTYGLKLPPTIHLHRSRRAESVEELLAEHREFLTLNGAGPDRLVPCVDAQAAREQLRKCLNSQVEYNVGRGILINSEEPDYHYSWRGAIHIAGQVVKDLTRL